MMKFEVVTADSWRTIARGFNSQNGAESWADAHDYGQYENEGGWIVRSYEVPETN